MKTKFIFLLFLLIYSSFYSPLGYSTINSYEEDYLEEETTPMDFHSFRDELNYLENETKNLDKALSTQTGVETGVQAKSEDSLKSDEDSISTTSSAVKREPAVVDDEDLKMLLETPKSNKQRRIRSR